MDSCLRGLAIYFFLLLIFKVCGKRTLAQVTTFDFVLLLIISETTQQALLGEDFSITGSLILISTLVLADVAMDKLKARVPWAGKFLEGVPLVLVSDGQPLRDRMKKSRVDDSDILAAAREIHGITEMDDIRFAVLERDGEISIIPKQG